MRDIPQELENIFLEYIHNEPEDGVAPNTPWIREVEESDLLLRLNAICGDDLAKVIEYTQSWHEYKANVGITVKQTAVENLYSDIAESSQDFIKIICSYPILDGQQFLRVWTEYVTQANDPVHFPNGPEEDVKNLLIFSNARGVVSMAHSKVRPGISIEDLIQEGLTGIIEGLPKYKDGLNPNSRSNTGLNSFNTYALSCAGHNMYRYISKNQNAIEVPENVRRRRDFITKTKNIWAQDHSEDPDLLTIRMAVALEESRKTTTLASGKGNKKGYSMNIDELRVILEKYPEIEGMSGKELKAALTTIIKDPAFADFTLLEIPEIEPEPKPGEPDTRKIKNASDKYNPDNWIPKKLSVPGLERIVSQFNLFTEAKYNEIMLGGIVELDATISTDGDRSATYGEIIPDEREDVGAKLEDIYLAEGLEKEMLKMFDTIPESRIIRDTYAYQDLMKMRFGLLRIPEITKKYGIHFDKYGKAITEEPQVAFNMKFFCHKFFELAKKTQDMKEVVSGALAEVHDKASIEGIYSSPIWSVKRDYQRALDIMADSSSTQTDKDRATKLLKLADPNNFVPLQMRYYKLLMKAEKRYPGAVEALKEFKEEYGFPIPENDLVSQLLSVEKKSREAIIDGMPSDLLTQLVDFPFYEYSYTEFNPENGALDFENKNAMEALSCICSVPTGVMHAITAKADALVNNFKTSLIEGHSISENAIKYYWEVQTGVRKPEPENKNIDDDGGDNR